MNPHNCSPLTTAKIGILLTNVGTPANSDIRSVRKYLAEFLSDPRVIQIPKLIWWPLLHGIILRTRPKYSAHNYQKIWLKTGSPLLVYCQNIAKKLKTLLATQVIDVQIGMRYGQPSIATSLKQLQAQHCEKILIFPLFPQYSNTTTAATFDAVTQTLKTWQVLPELRMINHYYREESYLHAAVQSIKKMWQVEQNYLLFSFHGIPQAYVAKGDPYPQHCYETAENIAKQLNLSINQWSVAFQSRLGRTPWLQPYTDKVLQTLPAQGIKKIDVICCGFAVDCLETLEEIAIQNKALFLEKGGQAFRYIPALNDSNEHINALALIIQKHLQGW